MKYKASASSTWAFAGTSSVTQSKSREINTCGFETAKSLLCMHMCMITRPRKTLRCFFFFKGIKVNALNCKCFGTFDSELFKYSKEKGKRNSLLEVLSTDRLHILACSFSLQAKGKLWSHGTPVT